MISFDRVTKQYPAPGSAGGTSIAVEDLTLDAPTGAITVLVGPSGCGKTTTLRMVNRMIEPTRGQIRVDGRDTASLDPAQLRRGIGYVIQHGGLFPHLTVERNIMTVPLLLGQDKASARRRARELLTSVGLADDVAGRYPASLSGGQQQRVGVARALAADPPVLLMDEPFSAVDPVVREQLQDELLELQATLRKTILFVTHDIDEAIKLGDQVAVLRVGGRLAQVAAPEVLLAHPSDDFVADFVGRDRGYRSLGFTAAGELPLEVEASVPLGATREQVRAAAVDGWALVVDGQGRPLGWVEADRVTGPVTRGQLALGGTLASVNGSLRAYLDAALSSPSRRGVVVDPQGALLGTVRASAVLVAIDRSERPAQGAPHPDHPDDPAPGSSQDGQHGGSH